MSQSIDALVNKIEVLKNTLTESFLFTDKPAIQEFVKNDSKIDLAFNEVFSSFSLNVNSILSITQLPFTMSFERAIHLMYDDIFRKERILSSKNKILFDLQILDKNEVVPTEEENLKSCHEAAAKIFNEKIKSEESGKEIMYQTLKFINEMAYNGLSSNTFLDSAKELINQGTLLTWCALEILARDIFVIYLNVNPKEIERLSKNPILRNKFDLKAISTEKLLMNNFNLSESMGDILIENFDFSNIDIIREVFKSLFDSEQLNINLKDPILWKLYQRRNLIVHRGGIVDEKYNSKTNDSFITGEKLFVKSSELKLYIAKVVEVANDIITLIKKINSR